jgi:tripartite-type tricarboxylate transporter receptor subunit TctC
MHRVAAIDKVKASAAAQGAELAVDSPEEFGAHIKAQMEKWGKLVRAAHMKAN